MQIKVAAALAMEELGECIAGASELGVVIYLQGELGAGKTTLVRGFLHGFGYKEHVRSPTFNLFELYHVKDKTICHFDLYRLKKPEEMLYVGAIDYFDEKNICLIEWPEKGEGYLPSADLFCRFSFVDDFDARMVDIIAESSKGDDILRKIDLTMTKK